MSFQLYLNIKASFFSLFFRGQRMTLYSTNWDIFILRISFHLGYLGRQLSFSFSLVQQGTQEQNEISLSSAIFYTHDKCFLWCE